MTYRSGQFEQLVDRFQAELDRLRGEAGFPGGTAAFILPDGRYYGFATGLADRERNFPMTPYTRLMSGSVGKSFVAAVALSLAQEGKLDLDEKIERWLGKDDWFSRLPNGDDITLRMLLTHSSGLIDHVFDERFEAAVRRLVKSPDFDPDTDTAFSHRELVAFVLDTEPLFPAGKGHSYTDTGYVLVGLIIGRASGSTYYKELQRRFLDPLNLSLTSPSDRRDLPELAPGYEDPDNAYGFPEKMVVDGLMVFNPAMEWTGGGLVTNPKDLVIWAKALYEGKAMEGPYLNDLFDSVPMDQTGVARCGAGVFIVKTEQGTIYGHSGWFPGYQSSLAYFPEHRVAVSMQVNSTGHEMSAFLTDLARVVLSRS